MRKILLLALVFLTTFTAFGQDFSNKGTEFWTCFPNHIPSGASLGQMTIWITSDLASSGTVSITNGSFSAPFSVAANGIVPINIPYANAHISNAESGLVIQKSIKIKVDAGQPPVVAYAQQYGNARSAATLLLPTNVLGKKYRAFSFTHTATSGGGQNSRSQFQIIATQPNTQVEVTPYANGVKGTTFTIVFPNIGDMYQYQASVDVTGTLIESIATGSGSCLPIAVFSGHSGITIGSNGPTCNGNSYDPLFQQCYPISTWGKNYGFIPFGDYTTRGNPYRVMASEDNTTVYFNGVVVANLNAGQIYPAAFTSNPVLLNAVTSITADKPISVAHYLQTSACSGSNNGDPDMVILNPIEQNIKDITVFASTQQNITRQWINVLIQTTAAGSFKIDGLAPTTAFVPAANIPGYSYLRHLFSPTVNGSHYLTADSGFNAVLYGYQGGQFESYAYSAGTNVKDLTQQLEIETTYGIETSPSVCTNSPFKFKVYFPDSTIGTPSTPAVAIRFDSLKWNLSNPTLIIPNNFPIVVPGTVGSPPTVAIDSINIRNGRQVAWYSIPTTYYFTTPGIDSLLVTGYTSTNEGCGNTKDYIFPIQVNDPPTASFTKNSPGCYSEPVVATEATPQLPKPTYKLWWEFFDPVTNVTTVVTGIGNAFRTATNTFTTPGVKRIRHSSITTPGCLSDTIVQFITLADKPFATAAGNTTVCINSVPSVPVTFTGTDGTAEYIFSYNINGGGTLTTPASTGGVYTINAPTNVAGPFVYNLIGVANALPVGTPCTRNITGQSVTVNINPLPNAAIAGATTVCLNSTPLPPVTFTGSGATAPYTFAYTINGVAQTPVVSNGAGVAIVNAPTNVVGIFIYEITQVTDASSTTCSSNITGTTTTITIQDLPTAAIASSTTAVCLNGTQPTVTFTGSGGTAAYTFNYTINSVAQTPVVSNAAGVATLTVPTTTAGSFVYEITQVKEGSGQTCVRIITGQTVTVTVNPLPNAAIAGAVTVCLNSAPDPVVTFTGSNATAPYTFDYTINGVAQTPIVSNAAGIATVNAPTTVVGTFIYAITQITDGSSTACSKPISGTSTTITIQDLPNAVIGGSTTTACLNSAPLPTITFTGNTGTAPYTFTYTINGVTQPTVVSNAAGVATITVPTNVATTYTYDLTAVSEASTQLCARAITGQTRVVVINPLPTASVAGGIAVCRNDPQPTVTFTGSGATAPYTFDYTINGTAQTPLVSNAAGVATVLAPTNVAGTFTYQLTRVTDASSTTCSQLQNGSTVITVNQLPTAAFTYTAPSCATRVIGFNDASTPNSGVLNSWTWDFGDGPPTSPLQNPTHVYAAAGTYNVMLTVTTDKGCTSNPIANIPVTINNRPQAGFIIPEVCLSDTYAQFLDTSKLTNAVLDRWDWNFGDPGSGPLNVSTLQNPTHSYSAVGTYNVRLIVWNFAKGCRDTITQVLQVNGSFPQAIFSVNNPTTLCANDSVAVVEQSTVFPGVITKIEIWWDDVNAGPPAAPYLDNSPFTGKVYKHLYPNFQSPLTKVFRIRYRAYSGGVCLDDSLRDITVNAAPLVQFNNIPNTCYLVAPFQIPTPGNGGVPGSGVFSGPGVSPTGIFNPQVAGIGTHTILYTYTSSAAGCVDTMSKTITVLDTAHATFSVVLPSCEQTATSFTNLSTAPAGVTLVSTVWDFGDVPGTQTFPIASPISHTYANPGTYTVTMHNVSTAGCLSTDTSMVVTIDANHHITWDATSGSQNQALCVNTVLNPIKYTLTGGATNVNFVPSLPAGLSYTVGGTPLTLTISGAPTTPANYNFSIQTTGNTCVTDVANVTISVAPDHAIALTSSNNTQTLCVNTAIADITYQLSGGATNIVMPPAGLPPGVNATLGAGGVVTLAGTPTLAGVYNYSIQTTGNTCLVATASGTITVDPDHTISLTSGNNTQTLCVNNNIAPINYQLNGGATNIVMPPAGLPPGVNATLGAGGVVTLAGAPTLAGVYNYSIQTTGNTCLVATATGIITVDPDHTITLTSGNNNQSVCVNTPIDDITYDLGGGAAGPVTFTPSVLPPGITSFVLGNVLTIRGTPTSTAGGPVFNYTITTNGNGCLQANASFQIQVHPYPVPDFTFDKSSYCIPNAVVGFINTTTPAPLTNYTYKWYFGDGDSSSAIQIPHYYTSAGPFNVILKARSTALLNNGVIGCESITPPKLLDIIHAQPKAGFDLSKPSVCQGDAVTITDATDGMGALVNEWHWDLGDGSIVPSQPVILNHTYPDTITYVITMYTVNAFGCNSDTINKLPLVGAPYKPFTVYPYPHPNAGPDKFVLEGGSVELEATNYGIQSTYSWTPIQYLTDSKILRPRVVNPKTDMTYRLTVTSKGGCQISDDVFVKLLKFPTIPNTFTPNNDGINDKWRIDYLNSYPDNRVQIFTRAGKLIFESRGYTTPWDGTFKGKPMPFDTYYYIIEPGNGRDPITGYVTIIK